jgi:hypothetical protein
VPVEHKAKNKSREGWQFYRVRKSRANPVVQPTTASGFFQMFRQSKKDSSFQHHSGRGG